VAGTVGAETNNSLGVSGVNWDVTIMPLRVLGVSGDGTCFDINESLRWAGRMSNGSGRLPPRQADVINLSLGGTSACPGAQDLMNQLASRKIIVIAAAGNDGTTNPGYPASLSQVISVSATTFADELAPYSTYGVNVDIAAPGGDSSADRNNDNWPDGVLSTLLTIKVGSAEQVTDYDFLNGTSMAAPHVAGVAALMKSVYAGLGATEFTNAVTSGGITVDLAQNGVTTRDDKFGYGRIDALKAVQWAVSADQGQQTSAFMSSSASALDFGSSLQTLDLLVEKGGSGTLNVTNVGWSENWMSVTGVGLDSSGFGRYRISIDRSGLIEGQYSAKLQIDANNGSQLTISILMRVGQNVAGQAGYVYALLLDQWTTQNVKFTEGPQVGSGFDVDLEDLPPGTYYLMVSTDIDNDNTVCDEGELCEFYPNNSVIDGIVITDSNINLGTFRMGFPVPQLKSGGQGTNAVVNTLSDVKTTASELTASGRITATRPQD
jgi:serine protease